MIEIVAPRLASTVLLLRDGSSSDIEVFMMVRHHQIEFNSGALVFPGGSVDKNDKEIAANPALYSGGDGLDGDALGFRIAAIRETFEESGILLARPRGSKDLVDARRANEIATAHRTALNEGKISFLKVLTDNGKEFTDRFSPAGEREPTGLHPFDRLCGQKRIKHRLIQPRHPQTNGMVERFNGRIAEILRSERFVSAADLQETLTRYLWAYNHSILPARIGPHDTY